MARDIKKFWENDTSLLEATSFLARVVQAKPDHAPVREPRLGPGKHFWWAAAILILLVAGVALGIRLTRQLKNSTEIQPPVLPLPSAPLVTKTAHRINRTTRAKAETRIAQPLTAEVDVEVLHHFKSGNMSLWLDNKLIYERALRGTANRHALFRTVEMNQTANLRLPVGKHQRLQVRVTSTASRYDQMQTIDADFVPESQHLLVVNCEKRNMRIALQPLAAANK
jgi:hypothetical protein